MDLQRGYRNVDFIIIIIKDTPRLLWLYQFTCTCILMAKLL